jgi:hypothetical protein
MSVTPKETAKQVIDSLPNDVTMGDIIRTLCVNLEVVGTRRGMRGMPCDACRREHKVGVTRENGTVSERLAQLGGKEGQARAPRRRRPKK